MSLPEGVREDFPDDAADLLDARASDRFAHGHGEYGQGQNWQDMPEGYNVHQAQGKLLEAEEHVLAEEPEEALTAMADALNYIRFEINARLSHSASIEWEEVSE